MTLSPGERAQSPCRGICRLRADELCAGCGRTIDEIVRWSRMGAAERAVVLRRVAGWEPEP